MVPPRALTLAPLSEGPEGFPPADHACMFPLPLVVATRLS